MAKGKSSASSGTRKKHARRAAAVHGGPEEVSFPKEKKPKKEKGAKKGKEPKKKVYIPPSKPAPHPDPLDTLGIAQRIPPELHVVLRKLAKKDSTTKRRALEDLQADWVEKSRTDTAVSQALVESLPVWFHHLPSLFIHPSRRIRQLAVGLHASLLNSASPLPEQALFFLQEVADANQLESILGTWRMAAHDLDRQVANYARQSWDKFIRLSLSPSEPEPTGSQHLGNAKRLQLLVDSASFNRLISFVYRVLLDPGGVYLYFNPPHYAPAPLPPHAKGAKCKPSPKKETESAARAKPEEEEEKEEDRNARLRSSAFGAAEWVLSTYPVSGQKDEVIVEFLSQFDNELLWSSLYYGRTAPFAQDVLALGFDQPSVRRSAWSFLQVLLRVFKGHLQTLLPLLSSAILRSAWVEPATVIRNTMWPPLLTFLKEFPDAWVLDASPNKDDESDDENDSDDEEPKASPAPVTSKAFQEFLLFLELGCLDSPLQGYPAVLIVLSTIPPFIFSTVKDPLQTLFTSFWAAIDGRALSGLDRLVTSAAFLSSVLESTVFMVRRLGHEQFASLLSSEEPKDAAKALIEEQIGRSWEELSSGRLKVQKETAAKNLAKTLLSLGQIDDIHFATGWDKLASLIRAQLTSANTSIPSFIPATLKVFQKELSTKACVNELVHEVISSVITELESVLGNRETQTEPERLASLIAILDAFGKELFEDSSLASAIDDAVLRHASRLLSLSLPLVLVYFSNRKDESLVQKVWDAVLNAVADADSFAVTLSPLLDATERKALPPFLKPKSDPLDRPAGQLMSRSLAQGAVVEVSVIEKLLKYPDYFISEGCHRGLISTLVETFSTHSQNTMYDDQIPLSTFSTPLRLLRILPNQGDCISFLPDLFELAFLVPEFRDMEPTLESSATDLWHSIMSQVSGEIKENISIAIRERVKVFLSDTSCLASSLQVLHVCLAHKDEVHVGNITEIIPPNTLNTSLDRLPDCPSNLSLAVIDPLVPTSLDEDDDEDEKPESIQPTVDRSGYSSYARTVIALVHYFLENRQLAKTTIWPFRHFLALAQYADERLQFPSATSRIFAKDVPDTILRDLQAKVQQLLTYVLSSVPDQFLSVTLPILLESGSQADDGIGGLLHQLIHGSHEGGKVRESRNLYTVLRYLMSSATKDEADKLLAVARKVEKRAPYSSLAIIRSVAESGLEPPGLERYRNQLAADVTGIRPAKVNTEGLWTLRRLNMVAPDPESDVIFLPTPRAVNLIRACQQWITSDEDIDEAVESELTLVSINLAPIVQNVVGSHWDLIFDVLENNLENCSFDDSKTLPTLSRSLRLLLAIQDLATTNKQLRESWVERQQAILILVRDLVTVKLEKSNASGPLSACREQALMIVQDLPTSLIDHNTLSKMCHLVVDSSPDVQTMAYAMLRQAAGKRTEYVVVEAAVDTEAEFKAELPLELIELLQQSLPQAEEPTAQQNILGSLLSWSLVFDLFNDASLKVKSGYIDHLRKHELISEHFLPEVFSILGLYEGVAKAFKLDIWSIDVFYLDLYSPHDSLSLSLLAAHLYYRALKVVPSLFRSWLLDCRDRQLSAAVTTYTSNYFSPALIRAELAQVKDPVASADLKDDNLTVKVANAVNEVTAAYAVDEYQLELKLRLPSDWPLHNIEVKDTTRVGVAEDRWRAWTLGVQQILSFRSGSIIDGIYFFKKNVTSHFEGQSECAICYSVISAMDGSLPKKPCKTCKNRFHSGCLYKWFSTSHSPTCPLCRSEIM